jgi:hypothetical protein
MHSVCVVVELRATVNYTKILSAAQQCFYGKIITSANTGIMCNSVSKELQLVCILFTSDIYTLK